VRKSFKSFIAGNFDGWDPDTVYVLDDGSTWKLAYPYFLMMYLYRPRVTVFTENRRHYMQVGFLQQRVQVVRLTKAKKCNAAKRPKSPEEITAWLVELRRFEEELSLQTAQRQR